MAENLSRYTVYVALHGDRLAQAHASGGAGEVVEKRKWATGVRLFHDARKAGRRLPALFVDAATTADLLYYAFLTDVAVLDDGRTRFRFEGLTPLPPGIPKSRLLKKSDSMPLSDDYQRSYSIVHTPDFLYSA